MVGTNGKRDYVADMSETNPEGWESDKRPPMKSFADMIVYELHHRDFSMDTESGMKNSGKFLALTEENTVTSDSLASGL
jgi:pullulanase